MQIPNISLAYLVAELKPLVDGSVLRKIQELPNGWLKIKLQTRQGTRDLIATPDALFLTSYSMPAKQQTSGFGAFLKKQLANKHLEKVEQHGLDRIVVMEFQDFFLIFELFAKGNVILTDKSKKILSAFRKEQWKDRTLKKGAQYKFPSSKGISPLSLDEKSLKKALQASNRELVPALVKEVNIAPSLAEEACSRTGLAKEKPARELDAGQISSLAKAIKDLYLVKPGKSKPALAEINGKKAILPFLLSEPFKPLKEFPSINQALDSQLSSSFQSKKEQVQASTVSKKKAELEHSMQQQKDALKSLQLKVEQNAQKAELIYQNYSQLFELLQAFKALKGQKMQEKEIMYKLKSRFPSLKEISLKGRKLVVSLKE